MTTQSGSVLEALQRIPVSDADSHVAEPGDLWTSRVPTRWGDAVPRLVTDDATGARAWYTGSTKICSWGGGFTGADHDEATQAGASEPHARLAWMDQHGVTAQVLYPNVLGFFVSSFLRMEPGLRLACVQAYNDFQTEFCSVAPDRLIPITTLPWWDLEESAVELDRCHAMGHRGVVFGWEFEKVGFPRLRSDHWAPLLRDVEERGLSLNFHIGFNSEALATSGLQEMTELDTVTFAALFFSGNLHCIAELIMGRICERYPTLKFVSVESGVGFLPYLVEALDWQFLNNNLHQKYPGMELPSEYFRRQIFGTFWFEHHVGRFVDLYPDNFLFSSDYPHATSLTPGEKYPFVKGPRDTILENLADLPEHLLEKVLHGNAQRVYGIA